VLVLRKLQTPDETKVHVGNSDNNSVYVIDTTTNTVTVTIPVGSVPWGVAVSPDGTRIYVIDGFVSVINTGLNRVVASVSTI
jgi:YVTN family beta-propeller protein